MGSNVSSADTDGTLAAYTLYGFGCRCANEAIFVAGHPQNDCCGTSCTRVELPPPSSAEHQKAILALEERLEDAQSIAMESITYWSYVICAGADTTSETAAAQLNSTWCHEMNQGILQTAGLRCQARREVYGFGRSRVAYLVLRVYAI